MTNTCCTWMFVRTHWGSVWECMTPEQYDAFMESMKHNAPRWFYVIVILVFLILFVFIVWEADKEYWDMLRK